MLLLCQVCLGSCVGRPGPDLGATVPWTCLCLAAGCSGPALSPAGAWWERFRPQRHPPGPEGRMGPVTLAQARAGHSCPADARGLLWWPGPSPQNSPVCTCPLALTAFPPHPTASDRVPGAGACCCWEALPLDWCQLCQVLVPKH